jgi:hypothetical protein
MPLFAQINVIFLFPGLIHLSFCIADLVYNPIPHTNSPYTLLNLVISYVF